MIEGIGSAAPFRGPAAPAPMARPEAATGERSFREILADSLASVNRLQGEADLALEKYSRGEAGEIEVTVAFKKAQIAFEALMQIRNKLVSAFDEIQRMRI
jgi:flagellar hook-basal body complex protein FliE